MSCSKCGTGRMYGPVYQAGRDWEYKPECLIYTCSTCGYSRTEPTHEQRKRKETEEKLRELIDKGDNKS